MPGVIRLGPSRGTRTHTGVKQVGPSSIGGSVPMDAYAATVACPGNVRQEPGIPAQRVLRLREFCGGDGLASCQRGMSGGVWQQRCRAATHGRLNGSGEASVMLMPHRYHDRQARLRMIRFRHALDCRNRPHNPWHNENDVSVSTARHNPWSAAARLPCLRRCTPRRHAVAHAATMHA